VQFATNLKYLRDERKLSNYRLAMDLGCSQSTIKNWISGDNTPHPKMQKTIADYFGITVDALNGDELPILPAQDTKKERPADGEALSDMQLEAIEFVKSLTEDKLKRFLRLAKAAFEEDGK
jgi:transcriptional regulator with XRE-family HTH domain